MNKSTALAALVGAAALCVPLSHANAATPECQSNYRADFGARTVGSLFAKSGQRCLVPLNTGLGSIGNISLSSPRAGTVVAHGRNSFTYQSRPGFVGRDRFVLRVDGQSSDGSRGTTTIAFEVSVSP